MTIGVVWDLKPQNKQNTEIFVKINLKSTRPLKLMIDPSSLLKLKNPLHVGVNWLTCSSQETFITTMKVGLSLLKKVL